MTPINLNEVTCFVEERIPSFHEHRLTNLSKLKLHKVLKRKNPYLFRAKNVTTANELITGILDAHLSSQEETLFGAFLEDLAIFVCEQVYGGRKSTAEGVDLEFQRDDTFYIVSIKSGPNWGNSSQIARMKNNFKQAIRRLRQNSDMKAIVAVNGCCYGQDNSPDKGDYLKLCGQHFWEFISGDEHLYIDIIEPLGHKAKEKNEEFLEAYAQLLNKFTYDFMTDFCDDGIINWEKLIKFNSAWKKISP